MAAAASSVSAASPTSSTIDLKPADQEMVTTTHGRRCVVEESPFRGATMGEPPGEEKKGGGDFSASCWISTDEEVEKRTMISGSTLSFRRQLGESPPGEEAAERAPPEKEGGGLSLHVCLVKTQMTVADLQAMSEFGQWNGELQEKKVGEWPLPEEEMTRKWKALDSWPPGNQRVWESAEKDSNEKDGGSGFPSPGTPSRTTKRSELLGQAVIRVAGLELGGSDQQSNPFRGQRFNTCRRNDLFGLRASNKKGHCGLGNARWARPNGSFN
ncbi:unnamed protein product [Linum trigynum]|uniref:Uncharacterized protein n=1 Tax=Linum trigynum TaxID=586398 RepID=A0AAV2D7T7_9ROSI